MIRRSLIEWQSLAYGEGDECIPAWAADRLVAVARRSPLAGKNGKGILEHGRLALGARQVVGVIVADGCALEILPKIEAKPSGSDSDNRGYLRDRLVHMLAVALDLVPGVVLAWLLARRAWRGRRACPRHSWLKRRSTAGRQTPPSVAPSGRAWPPAAR